MYKLYLQFINHFPCLYVYSILDFKKPSLNIVLKNLMYKFILPMVFVLDCYYIWMIYYWKNPQLDPAFDPEKEFSHG